MMSERGHPEPRNGTQRAIDRLEGEPRALSTGTLIDSTWGTECRDVLRVPGIRQYRLAPGFNLSASGIGILPNHHIHHTHPWSIIVTLFTP